MKTLEQIELQEVELTNKRADIHSRQYSAIRREVLPFFQHLTPEVLVEFNTGSIYFKMAHPDRGYIKELFSVYLKQSWSDNTHYSGLDLSYYTTSVSGEDKWELKRLQILGEVAGIIHEHGDIILGRINSACNGLRAEYEELYEEMHLLHQEKSEVQNAAHAERRAKVLAQLCVGGVEFTESAYIKLKHNYTARVTWLAITLQGKKSCIVEFKYPDHDKIYQEERVDLESLLTQVIAQQNIQDS